MPTGSPSSSTAPSEYAQYGGNAGTAAGQITGFLNYVSQRYGTPAAAWAHEEKYHWYDQGGWLGPGSSGGNATGKPEAVLDPQQSDAFLKFVQVLEGVIAGRGGDGGFGQGITQNFYGNNGLPTAEQRQAMRLDLAAAIGVA